MMRVVLAVVAAAALGSALVVPDAGKQNGNLWAVLVAGSNSWFNYRHQSDVCHAYQILHDHGVPDDHIIVMMYDDLAHNTDLDFPLYLKPVRYESQGERLSPRSNPTPGVVINRPDGPNVYTGVPKDYVGKDVTPQNFLKVLKGDSEGLKGVGSGKVLGSGPNDRVFINLVDHGAPGIFGFPTSFLHVKDFRNAIQSMHRNKQFKDVS
ncbi:Legumain [Portunus trituberculatus]|uniref:Legumain n=1 Tax=Portunus trituberculatus TaxID=210409 RepID=A0A5B7IQG3_PORTR|nr:Legumain [Portunus trituberculatus]